MEFKIFYHDIFQKHLVPDGHPEKPDRIVTLNNMISKMFLKNKQKLGKKLNGNMARIIQQNINEVKWQLVFELWFNIFGTLFLFVFL